MTRTAWILAALFASFTAQAQLVLTHVQTHNVSAVVEPNFPGEALGHASVGFDGSNYWIGNWDSARFTRIALDGSYVDSFEVPGVTSTRGLTWDGSHLWAANGSTTLSRIDPGTRTVVATLALPVGARYAAFDATANGGLGGFWIGNFNTDILLVSMAGATLSTIPLASIPFPSRYGATVDNSGPTPILWLYYQGGTNNCQIGAIDLPSGTPRTETLNTFPLIPGATSASAGGIFHTFGLPGGVSTLLALAQGTPQDALVVLHPEPIAVFVDGFE